MGASPLRTVYTCYNNAASPCNTTSVVLPITQLSSITKLDNNLQAKKATTYSAYGLPLETDEYDFGSGAPGTLARKTIVAYAALSGIYDHPASIEVDNGAGAKQAYTSFGYDPKGNTTSISRWVAGTTSLTTNFTVNANGTVATATDANQAVTTYSYTGSSCNGAFPTTISLPGTLSTSEAWNCYVALPSSRTDANGQTTSFAYNDPFARVTQITNADGGVTNFTYTHASGSTPASAESALTFNSGASTVDILTTLDSLGRPHLEQRRQGPGAANFNSVETDYDADGRAYRVSQAYVGAAGASATTGTAFTATQFDGLNRPKLITDGGNGTLSYSYAGSDVLTTLGPAPAGENTKRRQFEYNGLGQLTSVCELTAASGSGTCGQTTSQAGYWTKYTYSALGEIVAVSQNAQSSSPQTRSFAFDGLGRLTSETNPESGMTANTFDTDATCGTSNGDLVKRVDAMGNVTCYKRDALHRVTAITYPSGPYSGSTPSKTFVFDAATVDGVAMANAKGRLAEAFTGLASGKITDEGFGYDVMGRPTDLYEATPNSGGWYHTAETYWPNGGVETLAIPGVPLISYGEDGGGLVGSVSAASGQNPVTQVYYDAAMHVTGLNYGSGDVDSWQFDPNTGRMTHYQFSVNNQADTGTLTWNANGTLASLAIADGISGSNDSQTCSYAHDDLGRLASVSCGSLWGQTFGFDPFGNITKSGSLNWQPGYNAGTNRYASASYDADGDVLNDGFHSYGWDAEGRPVSFDGGATTVTYDAFGLMVEQGGGYTRAAIPDLLDRSGRTLAFMSGQTLQAAYVDLPGGAAAQWYPSGLGYYGHGDWLASSRLMTTAQRGMYWTAGIAPYGEPYAEGGSASSSQAIFTGKLLTTEWTLNSELYDFPDRRYAPTQGRWLSPDPAGLAAVNPADPQSWNRYAYVENSPLSATDPLGLLGGGGDPGNCGNPCQVTAPTLPLPWQLLDPAFWDFGFGEQMQLQLPKYGNGTGAATSSTASTTHTAPSVPVPQSPGQVCENKVQNGVNSALNTSTQFLGPELDNNSDASQPGLINGAYNFNYFAPGVNIHAPGVLPSCGRFDSGLHIVVPGVCNPSGDPFIKPWGYNAQLNGSFFTAHIDSADPYATS